MKKLFGLLIFTVFFFTIKSSGGNHPSLSSGNKALNGPMVFFRDSMKKPIPADTAKKTADDDTTDDDNVRSFAIGLTYGTDQSFNGIHSNDKIPYLEPNFTYTAPSGFYVLVSFQDILVKDSGGIDAFDLNPGWNVTVADNTTWNFNLSHYTFRPRTPLAIKSSLSNELETYIDQWVGETEGKFSVDYDYYKQTPQIKTPGDIVLTPDIAHTFNITLGKGTSLSFIPEGSVDFGTRNAYSQYQANAGDTVQYVLKKGKEVKVRKPLNNSSFGTVDYSLVFTIDLKIGNFEIEPAFNYNKALYNPSGVPTSPLRYGTLAFIYTIEKKKKK
jgi:hypothetical protein